MPRLMIIGGGPRKQFTVKSGVGSTLATFNFVGLTYGDDLPDRVLAIGINVGMTGTNFAINSVTVDGVGATSVIQQTADDSTLKSRSAIYRVAYPTTLGDTIQVALAGIVGQCQLGVWAMYGLSSAVPAFTASGGAIDGNPVNTTINVPASGLLITTAQIFFPSGLHTLGGAVMDDSEGVDRQRIWSSYQAGAAETARALSSTGGGAANSGRTLVAASWS